MTRIPIDLAAPIACTADGAEIAARMEQVEHLRDRLRSVDRIDEGLVLHFAPDAALESHLIRFVLDEKRCCTFWGFEIEASDDLTLRWTGPPDAQPLLDELHRSFTSGGPLTALSRLLEPDRLAAPAPHRPTVR